MSSNNLIELMAQTKNYEAHRKKLSAIMKKDPSATFNNRRIKAINTFYSNHDRAQRYSHRYKQQAVEKENGLILKKIIGVSNRRNSSLQQLRNSRYSSHNNMASFKKNMQNIYEQNHKIAQKLVTTNSNLRQEKLGESYRKHLERKERIKKYEYDEEVGMVVPKKVKSLQKFWTLEGMQYGDDISKYQATSRVALEENQER